MKTLTWIGMIYLAIGTLFAAGFLSWSRRQLDERPKPLVETGAAVLVLFIWPIGAWAAIKAFATGFREELRK